MKSTILVSTSMMMAAIFVFLTVHLKKGLQTSSKTWTQFECGFDPQTQLKTPFSFQFFLIALLFLIFDIEIVLLLAHPLETQSNKKYTVMMLTLAILVLALMYEWQKAKIDWSK